MTSFAARCETFRRLHHAERPLLLPNAWDYASAAAFASHGFPAIGTTSLGVAAASGKRDGTGRARDETLRLARLLSEVDALISVDVEYGFSERPAEVAAFVAELAAHDVVAINIEDGRPDGSLIAADRHAAVIAAIRARTPDLFINARTDTFWLPGEHATLKETIRRGRLYLAAGADGLFVPGVADEATVAACAAEVDAPLNVLLTPGGPDLDRLAELGVRRVSFGSLLFRAAISAAARMAAAVRAGQPLEASATTPSYADVQRLVQPGDREPE